jgi:hypothetical protein
VRRCMSNPPVSYRGHQCCVGDSRKRPWSDSKCQFQSVVDHSTISNRLPMRVSPHSRFNNHLADRASTPAACVVRSGMHLLVYRTERSADGRSRGSSTSAGLGLQRQRPVKRRFHRKLRPSEIPSALGLWEGRACVANAVLLGPYKSFAPLAFLDALKRPAGA